MVVVLVLVAGNLLEGNVVCFDRHEELAVAG
jgi:hypothetical protein